MSEPAGEGLWDQLRRRRVVQWAIAYVAAGWGLLQGLGYVGAAFHWPEQLQRFAIVAFFAGLPIALVVAWYHGDRGRQKVGGAEFAILISLLLLGGGMFWWVGRMPVAAPGQAGAPSAGAAQAASAAQAAGTGPSIAVLPFVNMSQDKDNEYFADGISEELLNVLVRVKGLGIASRTSSFVYKGSPLGTADIARALKVNHVLEGSVRKSGNRVRITAQLIDAVNDRHLWSETYDRELTDIFAIQEEIANAIVNALRAQLQAVGTAATGDATPAVTVRADTDNVEAYQLYLKARELFIARSDLRESIRLFEKVTQMDSGFARGWEGLAAVCSVAPSWGIIDRDYYAIATQAAERALKLDPTLSMPWAAIANVGQSILPVDWAANIDMLGRAISADPRNSTAYLWRSIAWINLGFFDRAVADLDRCLQLDPQYRNCTRWKALALLFRGRTDAAMALFEEGVAVGFTGSHEASFVPMLLRRGDRVGAMLLLQQLVGSLDQASVLLKVVEHRGPLVPAEAAILNRAMADKDSKYNVSIGATTTHQWLGEYDRIATAADFSASFAAQWEPDFPGLVNSPGFKAMLERLGVPAYWRKHGYPPQCRPVGTQDYTCS
jgi:adenylate cyclase